MLFSNHLFLISHIIVHCLFVSPLIYARDNRESRYAVLEQAYLCNHELINPPQIFAMPVLRAYAELARKELNKNLFSLRADRTEFPKLFNGAPYGCNGQNRCIQWPIPHHIPIGSKIIKILLFFSHSQQ